MDLAALSFEEWEEAAAREALRAKRMSEIALGDLRKPPPLIHGLLLDKTLTMISAEPYTGKTLLSLAIALALDAEKPVLSQYQVRERKKILFIGQDATSWDYAEQSRKLIKGYDLSDREINELEIDLILNTGLNLLEPKTLSAIQTWHNISGFDVIILDTLASLHSADENSSRDMSVVFTILKALRDNLNCCVIFTHHTSKPAQGVARSENYSARGSSIIAGSIDFHLHLISHPAGVLLNTPKGRGASKTGAISFTIEEGTLPSGDDYVKLLAPPPFNDTLILSALAAGPKTRRELIQTRMAPTPLIDNALARLARSGKIKQLARSTWSLTP